MRGRKFYWIPMALAGALICPTAAFPNDSAAELSIGGLRFTRTNEITIDSEELRISIDRVDVRYRFTNTSGKPVTLTLAEGMVVGPSVYSGCIRTRLSGWTAPRT